MFFRNKKEEEYKTNVRYCTTIILQLFEEDKSYEDFINCCEIGEDSFAYYGFKYNSMTVSISENFLMCNDLEIYHIQVDYIESLLKPYIKFSFWRDIPSNKIIFRFKYEPVLTEGDLNE